jgi:hypothetical protein
MFPGDKSIGAPWNSVGFPPAARTQVEPIGYGEPPAKAVARRIGPARQRRQQRLERLPRRLSRTDCAASQRCSARRHKARGFPGQPSETQRPRASPTRQLHPARPRARHRPPPAAVGSAPLPPGHPAAPRQSSAAAPRPHPVAKIVAPGIARSSRHGNAATRNAATNSAFFTSSGRRWTRPPAASARVAAPRVRRAAAARQAHQHRTPPRRPADGRARAMRA